MAESKKDDIILNSDLDKDTVEYYEHQEKKRKRRNKNLKQAKKDKNKEKKKWPPEK